MAAPLIPLAIAGLQVGHSIFQNYQNNRAATKAKNNRRDFWSTRINPLLDRMDNDYMTDEEASYLRNAEMEMPNLQMENQMRGLASFSDTMQSKSGFSSSGFMDSEFSNQQDTLNRQYSSQKFGVDRGIMDMQRQINDLVDQNKLRRTELEFSYKYG